MHISDDFYKFIADHKDEEVTSLRLKFIKKGNDNIDYRFAIDQIECRKRCKSKLPTLITNHQFLFASTLSAEQSSSEIMAEFHSSLLSRDDKVLDMTGGLGVDDIFMAKYCASVTAIEINPFTAEIAAHNAEALNITNLKVLAGDSIEYLETHSEERWDKIFIDPARRDNFNKRTFAFADCTPDVVHHYHLISRKCSQLIIKASPMLDISAVIKELPNLTDIYILSIKNECKEILCICKFQETDADNYPIIHTLNFLPGSDPESFSFRFGTKIRAEEILDKSEISQGYLYEPNSSITKSGGSDILTSKFDSLKKLNINSHLYHSHELITDFPGRILEIMGEAKKSEIAGQHLNVVCRNYPMTPAEVKKKYRIKDGTDNRFLYYTRVTPKGCPIMLETRKLN